MQKSSGKVPEIASKQASTTSKLDKEKDKPAAAASSKPTASTAKAPPKNFDWLPGQKFDTPEEGDGQRIFYESLRNQRPTSAMAEKWCLEYGLLDPASAQRIAKKYEKMASNAKK